MSIRDQISVNQSWKASFDFFSFYEKQQKKKRNRKKMLILSPQLSAAVCVSQDQDQDHGREDGEEQEQKKTKLGLLLISQSWKKQASGCLCMQASWTTKTTKRIKTKLPGPNRLTDWLLHCRRRRRRYLTAKKNNIVRTGSFVHYALSDEGNRRSVLLFRSFLSKRITTLA